MCSTTIFRPTTTKVMANRKYISGILGLFALIALNANPAAGQGVAISETNTNPDPSAALDVQSVTKGMMVPRMTAAQRNAIAGPADGLVVYQTNDVGAETHGYWYYDSGFGAWLPLGMTMYTGVVEQPGTLVGSLNHTATVTSLDPGQTDLSWTIPTITTRPTVLAVPEYTVVGTPPDISDYCLPLVTTCNSARQNYIRFFSPDSDYPGFLPGANNFSSLFFPQTNCFGANNVNYHYIPFDGGSFVNPGTSHNNMIIDFCANPSGEIAMWTTSAVSSPKSFSVWMDLNQNGNFTDPGEFLASYNNVPPANHIFATTAPAAGPPITVPNGPGTNNGMTKMRLMVRNTPTAHSSSCFGGDNFTVVYDIEVEIQCATGGAPFYPSEINWCNVDDITTNSARISCFDQNGTPTDLKYHYKIISHD